MLLQPGKNIKWSPTNHLPLSKSSKIRLQKSHLNPHHPLPPFIPNPHKTNFKHHQTSNCKTLQISKIENDIIISKNTNSKLNSNKIIQNQKHRRKKAKMCIFSRHRTRGPWSPHTKSTRINANSRCRSIRQVKFQIIT